MSGRRGGATAEADPGGVSRLVTGAVLKTVVAEHLGQAGSIPVRLRQASTRPAPDSHAHPHPPDPAPGAAMGDHRRLTPRTDHVLADPGLVRAAERLGPLLVRGAGATALGRGRAGGG